MAARSKSLSGGKLIETKPKRHARVQDSIRSMPLLLATMLKSVIVVKGDK